MKLVIKMVIYVDLIIILNIFIDFILLLFENYLLKRNGKLYRIILAAIVSGVSTILLFYIKNNTILLGYKLLISILMVIIAFKYQNFYYFKDNIIWLYILSIVLGGALYFLGNQINLSNNNILFASRGLKVNIIFLLFLAPILLYRYVKISRKYKITYSNYYDTVIYYDDVILKGTGFLDTGNNLKDPYLNRPIVLINKELITKKVNTFLVPYHTVNNDGLLEVFKPEKIIVNKTTVKNVLVGLTDVNINGIKIILNKEAL